VRRIPEPRFTYPDVLLRLKVPKQAFIDVDQANNPVLGYGLDGIVGLGFTALSNIDYALNETSSDTGRSLLYNLFTLNPSEPNFLAFSLLRSTDPDDEVEGSFSIGKDYDHVLGTVLSTFMKRSQASTSLDTLVSQIPLAFPLGQFIRPKDGLSFWIL